MPLGRLQGRLLGESAEHTHEGDLVRETQPVVGTPPQGDLAAVGLEEGGITGVSRTALYSFMSTRGLRPSR